MSTAVALLNVVLGLVYTSYGIITLIDLRAGWGSRGRSHFGMAWVAMAFTCGPHHLEHGLHILTTSRTGGPLDFAAVAVGFPAGVAWFLLRVEAVRGGRGDRTIRATPAWVESLPTLSAVYVVALVTAVLGTAAAAGGSGAGGAVFDVRLTPNLALVALYAAIGVVLARTQLQNHQVTGNWSLSGLSLAVVFPTCALMHGVWAVYGATGRYEFDAHLLAIDVLAVPAAMYFLWVVWSLATGRMIDWNHAAGDARPEPVPA